MVLCTLWAMMKRCSLLKRRKLKDKAKKETGFKIIATDLSEDAFTPWALRAIHKSSRGIPRVVNNLLRQGDAVGIHPGIR